MRSRACLSFVSFLLCCSLSIAPARADEIAERARKLARQTMNAVKDVVGLVR